MTAVVVGGGLGGLTATLALRKAGHSAVLVERDPEPRAVGAGLMLGANACACLAELGLGEAIRRIGRPVRAMGVTDARGRVLQAVDVGELGLEAAGLTVDRGALHRALLDAVGEVRGGSEVAGVVEGGVALADGSVVAGEVVIGADGLFSAIRRAVGSAAQVRYSGQTCWRFVVPDVLGLEGPVERWGPGLRVGWVPLSEGRLYGYLVVDAPAETWRSPVTREALLERFAGFGPEVAAVLAAAEHPVHHDLCELDAHCWGKGRVVLIGDAAHGMTPNLGQGAAMAIEDGFTLPEVVALADPASALAERRAGRVGPLARVSRWLGWMAHWRSPVLRSIRDGLMVRTPASAVRRPLAGLLLGGPVPPPAWLREGRPASA